MAALIDAIEVKRKAFFEFENTPFLCLEAVVNTPTARGGQTLVRLKMRNLLTNAVFEKSFKASDKFKEPDLAVGSRLLSLQRRRRFSLPRSGKLRDPDSVRSDGRRMRSISWSKAQSSSCANTTEIPLAWICPSSLS